MIDTRASNCRLCFKTIDASSPLGIELLLRLLDDCFAQKPPAMPADVRKRSALPVRPTMNLGLRPKKLGVAQNREASLRKAKGLPHISRHSRRFLGKAVVEQPQE